MNLLCNWLSERIDHGLHSFQLSALSHIVRKIYSDFELQGIEEEKLNSKVYQTIMSRIQLEEAAASVSNGLNREHDDSEEYPDSVADAISKGKVPPMNRTDSESSEGGNYVSRIQNATQNVMGRITGIGRGVGNIGGGIGGFANKFLNNF
jgi:hypothetical protein